MNEVSRRSFGRLLGAGAALVAFPDVLARTTATGPILLNSNENPYGPSPAAVKAMRDAIAESFRYPDDAEAALAETIAASHGVSTSAVLLGNGSSDILRLAADAFLPGGKKLVTADPTFESLWHHARGNEIVKVPLDAAFAHDLPKMLEAARGAALVYVCNPNNPTATITAKAAVRAFLDAVSPDTIVLVDEAYHHYVESSDYESVVPLIAKKPNLVVARTFSKIYAMAGLRAGYALASADVIKRLDAQKSWDTMNIMALAAARASLADGGFVAEGRRRNSAVRASVVDSLGAMGYKTIPSEANFIMIDTGREVRPLIAAMRTNGVHVGRLFPALPHHLRVTIGTPDEMKQFLDAFRRIEK